MNQFNKTYADTPKLAALLRVLPWTHNLMILGQSKRPEEREFYLQARGPGKVEFARTCSPDQECCLRADCLVGQDTRISDASFAPGRHGRIQEQLPPRLP
jgi:hypothetical protein